MTELTKAVFNDERVKELGMRGHEVKVLVRVVLEHMGKGLIEHGKIKLQGLFSMEIRGAKGRRIANPQTGEEMFSKDYNKLNVEPSKKLKDEMKKLKVKL